MNTVQCAVRGTILGEEFTQCRQILAELQQSIKLKLGSFWQKMKNLIPDFPSISSPKERMLASENKPEY